MINVKDLVGVPYKDYGRSKEGLDCYGLAIEVLRRAGKTLPDIFYDSALIESKLAIKSTLESSIPNTVLEKSEEAAIVEILIVGQPSHCGVCLDNATFIHAMKQVGVVVEPLYRYNSRIKGFYRVNN